MYIDQGPDWDMIGQILKTQSANDPKSYFRVHTEGSEPFWVYAFIEMFKFEAGEPNYWRVVLRLPKTGERRVGVYSTETRTGMLGDPEPLSTPVAASSSDTAASMLDINLAALGFDLDIVEACNTDGIKTWRELMTRLEANELDIRSLMLWYDNPTGMAVNADGLDKGMERFNRLQKRIDKLKREYVGSG